MLRAGEGVVFMGWEQTPGPSPAQGFFGNARPRGLTPVFRARRFGRGRVFDLGLDNGFEAARTDAVGERHIRMFAPAFKPATAAS